MKTCKNPQCSQQNNARINDINFCSQCGWKMYDLAKCACGNDLLVNDKFCEKCGTPRPKVVEEMPDKYLNLTGNEDLFDHERSVDNLDDEPENL